MDWIHLAQEGSNWVLL